MPSISSRVIEIYKDSLRGHQREIWILVILFFINRVGTMVIPFLSVYLTTILDYSLKEAGLLLAAFGLGSFVGAYIGGRLSDSKGPNFVIFLSLLISGLLFICIQWITEFNELFAIIFFAALFGDAYRPAGMAYVSKYVEKEQRGRTMALMRVAINLGTAIGPMAAGFIAVALSYSWLFWIDGATCILGAIYFFLSVKGNLQMKVVSEEENDSEFENSEKVHPLKNSDYVLFLIASFLVGIAFNQWFNSIPVFIKSEWGFDERYLGALFAINSLMIFFIELPLINEMEKYNKMKLSILGSLILMSFAFIPFFFKGTVVLLVIAIVLFTFGEILFFPFNNAIPLNMASPVNMGNYMSWYWMAWSLTSIIGPFIGMYIAEQFGFSILWISMIGITVLSLGFNYFFAHRIIK